MRTARTLPSPYSPGAFHAVRALSFVATIIVAAIMIYFAYHLHQDGFKLPWTFVVIMATCFLTLLNLAFTGALFCCGSLSPMLSLVFNTAIFLLWIVSLGLLSWSMSGTLSTTCDTTHWGTDTGVMVCRVYKTLFSFVVVAFAAQFVALVVDSAARRHQRSMGDYNAMTSDTMLTDVKLDQRSSLTSTGITSTNPNDPTTDAYNAFGTVRPQEPPQYGYGQSSQTGYYSSPYREDDIVDQHHAGEAQEYYDNVPAVGGGGAWTKGNPHYSPLRTRMDDLRGYSAPTEETHYDPGNYR
ncbi:hypothetical protein VTN77DRAFT_3717 [Rasamsonia byssochlamydoides]|uniref:uncharacterized protein n=1 Tax=Rasamsonia byssochlamydoides TaxID=89139 RepID=UPI003743EA6D